MIAEKYLVRHFLSIQQSLEDKELDNIYWLPGTENPADGMTKMKSETSPMLNLSEFGEFHPGLLRPLLGIGSSEPARKLGGGYFVWAITNLVHPPAYAVCVFFFDHT